MQYWNKTHVVWQTASTVLYGQGHVHYVKVKMMFQFDLLFNRIEPNRAYPLHFMLHKLLQFLLLLHCFLKQEGNNKKSQGHTLGASLT